MLLVIGEYTNLHLRAGRGDTADALRLEQDEIMRLLIVLLMFALLLSVSAIFGFHASSVASGFGG